MPIKKLKKLFGMIISATATKNPKKKHHRKQGFIIKKGGIYEYVIIDIPDGYTIDRLEIKDHDYIIESHKLTKNFNAEHLKKRVALLNRRQRQHQERLRRRKK